MRPRLGKQRAGAETGKKQGGVAFRRPRQVQLQLSTHADFRVPCGPNRPRRRGEVPSARPVSVRRAAARAWLTFSARGQVNIPGASPPGRAEMELRGPGSARASRVGSGGPPEPSAPLSARRREWRPRRVRCPDLRHQAEAGFWGIEDPWRMKIGAARTRLSRPPDRLSRRAARPPPRRGLAWDRPLPRSALRAAPPPRAPCVPGAGATRFVLSSPERPGGRQRPQGVFVYSAGNFCCPLSWRPRLNYPTFRCLHPPARLPRPLPLSPPAPPSR